jgi:hypothetical protein
MIHSALLIGLGFILGSITIYLSMVHDWNDYSDESTPIYDQMISEFKPV